MEIANYCVYHVRIPFKSAIRNNLKIAEFSDSIVIVLKSTSGLSGYGEGIPDKPLYPGKSSKELIQNLISYLKEVGFPDFESIEDIKEYVRELSTSCAASSLACAMELALLDLMGQYQGYSASRLLGLSKSYPVKYTAILPSLPEKQYLKYLYQLKELESSHIKIKVGLDNDKKRLEQARQFLGDEVDIRVYANNTWNIEAAITKISALEKYNISVVEDPLISDDLNTVFTLTKKVNIPIMIDRRMNGLKQSLDFILNLSHPSRLMFNLKISKVGGILNALRIFDLASAYGIKCQMGSHFGESAILNAAGKILAHARPFVYVEGYYGKYFIDRKNNRQNTNFGGKVKKMPQLNAGFGLQIDNNAASQLFN